MKLDTSHLDGLRGLAALWVLVAHCMIWGGWTLTPIPDPKIAVDLFMLISGFLMVSNALDREGKEPLTAGLSWAKFYLRRYFRIAPAYYVSLATAALLAPWFLPGYKALQLANAPFWGTGGIYDPYLTHYTPFNLFLHATFVFGLSPTYSFSTMLPDWSLSLEMQFYVVFPTLFLLMRRGGFLPVAMVIGVAIFFVGRQFAGLFPEPSFLPLKLAEFLAGMVIARASRSRQSPLGLALRYLMVSAVSSLQASNGHGQWFLLPLLACLMLGLSCNQSPAGRAAQMRQALGGRWAHWLSEMSYAVYLFHGFFIALAGFLLCDKALLPPLSGNVRTAALIMIVAPCAYGLAVIVARYVEKPGITLGHWLARRW